MQLDVLFPPDAPADADTLLADLALGARGTPQRPYVLVNMVASLDGQVTVDGGSTGLGADGDKAMFTALRGAVDAILAGTGTVAAEGYGRLVRRPERRAYRVGQGLAADPALLLITRSGDVPWDAPVFAEPAQRVGIATRPGAVAVPAHVRAEVTVIELPDPEPRLALAALGEQLDLRSVLCEGGPTLNRSLLDAGVLDELFVTLAPTLAGGAPDARRLIAGPALTPPAGLALRWVLRAGDELLLRYASGA